MIRIKYLLSEADDDFNFYRLSTPSTQRAKRIREGVQPSTKE